MTAATLTRPTPSSRPGRAKAHSPAWLGLALGGSAAASVLPSLLLQGGLAALIVTALTALALGAPLAEATAAGDDADPAAWQELWRSTLLVSAAAALATAFAPLGGAMSTALGLGAWGLVGVLTRWGARLADARWGPVVFAASLLLATAHGIRLVGGAAEIGAPWSLLEPRWATWPAWLGGAASVGFLITLIAPGHWTPSLGPTRAGARAGRLPWGVAGAALLGLVLAAVAQGLAYEALPEAPTGGWVVAIPLALWLPAVGVISPEGGDRLRRDLLAGAAFTVWLCGPAWAAVGWWWSTLLPGTLALWVAERAVRLRHHPVLSGVAVAALTSAAALGFPGLPRDLGEAVAAATVVVAWVWIAGLRMAVRWT